MLEYKVFALAAWILYPRLAHCRHGRRSRATATCCLCNLRFAGVYFDVPTMLHSGLHYESGFWRRRLVDGFCNCKLWRLRPHGHAEFKIQLSHVMFATCAIAGIHYGTGRHFSDLTHNEIYMAMRVSTRSTTTKNSILIEVLVLVALLHRFEHASRPLNRSMLTYLAYCLTMIIVKLSIGLLLLRLTINKIHIWILYIMMALSAITGIVFFFVTMFQCFPVSFFWNKAEAGSCIDVHILEGLTYLYGAINAITDFTFGLLPLALIYNLQMDRKTKILLAPILSMGCM